MKNAARHARQIQVESFVDLVWAVPIGKAVGNAEAGSVLHRAKGLPRPGQRIVLLRGYLGDSAPSLLAV